jgi:hypothetical protein
MRFHEILARFWDIGEMSEVRNKRNYEEFQRYGCGGHHGEIAEETKFVDKDFVMKRILKSYVDTRYEAQPEDEDLFEESPPTAKRRRFFFSSGSL